MAKAAKIMVGIASRDVSVNKTNGGKKRSIEAKCEISGGMVTRISGGEKSSNRNGGIYRHEETIKAAWHRNINVAAA